MTISTLLVDDAADVRAMLRIAMRMRGTFDILAEAENGIDAAELAGALRPDVIVLDLGLPDLAGRELLDQIRRRSPTSRIVVFTGSDGDRDWFEERSAGYVVKSTELEQLLNLLEEVGDGQEHREAALEVPLDFGALQDVRALMRELLTRWELPGLHEDVALVVTELVANALLHAQSACSVAMVRSPNGVRIEVRDEGAGTPNPQVVDHSSERGRGLRIVAALSTAWGIESDGDSKTVWAELAAG